MATVQRGGKGSCWSGETLNRPTDWKARSGASGAMTPQTVTEGGGWSQSKKEKKQGPVGGKIERVGEGACNGTAGATVGNTPEMAENTPPHWAPGRWPQDGWGGHLC